ncbi:Hpt domain-containing protein [Thalassolituus sp.]|uniref:Hpt domain-containing protein n=1 Tax=Thalassolituus sp. TaxID=2030822 RepID=UPI003514796B
MSQDYIALEWVKGEIRETLQQAQQSLEAYVEHPEDRSRLRFCLSYLHQVHGTLQMVEFYGAALLAEEMEAVALALAEGQLTNEQDGLEVLMQAIIQLPHYLEHVKVGRRDLPVVLLPILNELRSTRGENFLSETSLFTPAIEHNTPLTGEQKNQFTQVNFSQWLRKTRQMLQAATLQLLQDREPDLAKHYLNKLFARLNKAMGGTPQGIIWLPALAFSEWLTKQDSLPKSAKVLLRQLDQLLKQDLDQGVAVINRPPADELLKNLLFYVARTDVRGDAIRLVQKRFRLDEALPSAEDVAAEGTMGGPGVDAVSGALSALIEEIGAVKDTLDQLMRGSQDRAPALEGARKTIRQVADTMGMLGLGMPRKVMQEQESQLVTMLESGTADDSALLDVAGALLYVEATLNGMLRDGDLSRNASDSAMSDAQRAVLREARNVLEQVKDSVVAYIAHQWSTDKLEGVPGLLHSIEGSLNMVPLPRVANLLADLSSFIRQALLSDRPKPEFGVMDMVAEVLSGIEYYLERYADGGEIADDALLDRASETLSNLLQICHVTSDGDLDESGAEGTDEFDDVDHAITSFNEALGFDNASSDYEESVPTERPEESSVATSETVTAPEEAGAQAETAEPEDDDLIDDEIIEVFLEEAEEVLETLQEYWPQFVAQQDDSEALTTVRRAFHTLKGSGRMVKAADIGELAWSVENMFNRVLDETVEVTQPLIAFVDHIISLIPGLIEDFRHKAASRVDVQPLMDTAFAFADGQTPALPVDTTEPVEATETESVDQAEDIAGDVSVTALEVLEADSLADDTDEGAASMEAFLDHFSEETVPDAAVDLTDLPQIESEELSEDDADRLSLLDVFIAETDMHLNTVDDFVQQSRSESFTNPVTDDLQRALHTLKGSAHMAELTPLAELASAQEHLVKELRGYQLPNSPALTDLLEDAGRAVRAYMSPEQLLTLEGIEGGDALHGRIADIEQNQLAHLTESEGGAGPSPDVLARFLSSGMDSLIRADELLQVWRDEDNTEVLDQLTADLQAVAAAAVDASLPMVADLSLALNAFYQRARQADAHPEASLVEFATEAHEELLNMMDYLAAGQDIPSSEQTIAALSHWDFPLNTAAQDKDDGASESSAEWLAEEPSSVDQVELDEQEDDMILDIFLEEADEISEAIESIMQSWQASPDDLLPVAQLQRELHTLKGGARMAELPEVADLCHELETLYERLNDGVIERSDATIPLIHRAHDVLAGQLQAVRSGQVPENASALIAEIHHMAAGAPQSDAAEDELTPPPVQNDVRSESADESDREIVGIFLEEAAELMESLDEAIESWRNDTDGKGYADEILRVLHTLKGGARLAGLTRIGDTTHNFETDVQKAVDRHARFDQTFFAHLHERQETLQGQIDEVARLLENEGVLVLGEKELVVESSHVDAPEDETLQEGVTEPASEEETTSGLATDIPAEEDDSETLPVVIESESAVPGTDVKPAESRAVQQSQMANQRKAPTELVKVSADLLDNLVNLAGETAIGRGRLEQQVSDFSHTLGEMDQTLDRLRDQLRRLDIETEAQVLFRQERHGPDYDDFDPLEMDRYSAIQQLSRALMESASDMLDLKETLSLKTRDAETLLLQQSRVNTELQEGLMKTRMVPFQRLVPRLRRIVRQVSLELNKQVDLRVNNADGEMDRTILERIISPLEHMVRNAVDHGIENTDGRQAAGKPAMGNIELDIRRDGGDVVLTLRDDGRGINLDAVLRKARNRGMIPADAKPTDAEIIQFIMQPGFSTAEVVTQISGRGVGMDVVNSEIKQMGGSLEVRSDAGRGTEFEIRLPFTVSVNRALMVRVGEDLYAVPLNNIQGIVRASVSELQALYERPEDERVFAYAGKEYQLGYLGAMLDSGSHPKIAGHQLPLPLLLIRGQVPFALQVDSLLGSREIVVKSLGPQFAGVRGISGGTILGDGSVVIILDLPAMIRTQTSLEYQQARALEDKAAEARHEHEAHLPKVLVVDDSVTVRKVTGRLLERHGMEVLTAKDGVHAMEVLQDHKPDVILLDIEMPRMDGFEVASLVRHDTRLQDVPIIMITSRTGEKHRERAMSIGVNDYLGKPFQEDTLLERIHGFLGQGVH